MKNSAFTLIELMVVIGVVGIIMTFSSVNLLSLRNKASINSIVTQLVADLKQQQIKSMIADTEGRTLPDYYGIHILLNSYVLFHGTTYLATSPDNFPVTLDQDLSLSNVNQSIIFKKGSGELETGSLSSLTINNSPSGEHKTININSFGVITSVN